MRQGDRQYHTSNEREEWERGHDAAGLEANLTDDSRRRMSSQEADGTNARSIEQTQRV